MSPITHLLVGWLVALAPRGLERRERALIALAGVAPDLDGLGLPVEILTEHTATPLLWYWEYHHVLLHNVLGAALMTGVALALARRRRALVAALSCLSFHLHLLGDLAGSRGPDGYPWPIPYLRPFSDAWQLTWSGQWELDAWPNIALTLACLGAAAALAVKRGVSPVEIVSPRGDSRVVAALRARLGRGPRAQGG